MASDLLSQVRPGWHFRLNNWAQWDTQVLASNNHSVHYPIVPMQVRVMHEAEKAEKAAQHLRVHLNFDRVMSPTLSVMMRWQSSRLKLFKDLCAFCVFFGLEKGVCYSDRGSWPIAIS